MNDKGLFVTVDGPGGVGKSTVVAATVAQLVDDRFTVFATREPTDTPLGNLARHGTETYRGMAMACLVAADRYQHLSTEIRPALMAGAVVVCDRYIASSLVLQRMDNITLRTIWELNRFADHPGLAVILTADPRVIADRLAGRGGPHSRYERLPDSSRIEYELYQEAAASLTSRGIHTRVLDATTATPEALARTIAAEVAALRQGHP
ncbi:dTMP kinase [Streptomyces radicis]|uniref:Thymidylate kinase n=1 Tax=Streptomyces radicis TaxID=1750517 RepID=A0A3A9WWS6_9ACTN|nr:dTMP kinase [Streptomyces radicis]RKN10627.1 dTMP kinase [Streptomyces radicis]RKN24887.1 dTMP kinase [Streptomyces radicis]